MIDRLGRRPYVDVNIWIYAVEQHLEFGATSASLFASAEAGDFSIVSSELCLAEALVMPFRVGDDEMVAAYRNLLRTRRQHLLVPVASDVLVLAARYRSASRMKLPDAIHFATAIQSRCTSFVTNDVRSWPAGEMPVVTLASLTA